MCVNAPAYARSAWGRYNGLFAASDGDPRYLAGKMQTKGGSAYVALMARARAVVRELVESYGIAASRLEGYGVGSLAPVAENVTAAGKGKNRRVELVAR